MAFWQTSNWGYGSVRTPARSVKDHKKKRIKRLHKDVPKTKGKKINWGKAEKLQKGVYESNYQYGME